MNPQDRPPPQPAPQKGESTLRAFIERRIPADQLYKQAKQPLSPAPPGPKKR